MDDPLEKIRKLKDLLAHEAESRGARLIRFSLQPTEPPELDVLLDLGESLIPVPQEEQDTLAALEADFREDAKKDQESQAIERLKALEEKLDNDGGFL